MKVRQEVKLRRLTVWPCSKLQGAHLILGVAGVDLEKGAVGGPAEAAGPKCAWGNCRLQQLA